MYCSSCGTAMAPGAAFCSACGQRAPAGLTGTPVTQPLPPLHVPRAPMAAPGTPFDRDPQTGLAYSSRSKVVAGLLQLLLGGLGIGRFYTGHTGMAVAQIAVTFITCGLGAVWPLIDGILMLAGNVRDAEGRPLRP